MPKRNWSLYLVGLGDIANAQNLLTNFVSTMRDKGLTITNVQVTEGDVHTDLADVQGSQENGFQMYCYGEGDPTKAYTMFPELLNQFEQNGINVVSHGIVQGALRDIPVPA